MENNSLDAITRKRTMKWISVKTELPDCSNGKANNYLIYDTKNKYAQISICNYSSWGWQDNGGMPCELTHWMSLPPKPNESMDKCIICSSTEVTVTEMRPLHPIVYRYYCEAHVPKDAFKDKE